MKTNNHRVLTVAACAVLAFTATAAGLYESETDEEECAEERAEMAIVEELNKAYGVGLAENAERDVIAQTLWLEARGEGAVGILAVASVIWNRAAKRNALKGGKFASGTLALVCLARSQFSGWSASWGRSCASVAIGWRSFGAREGRMGEAEAWRSCLDRADEMVGGTFTPSLSATHFYNARKGKPYWARRMRQVTVVGRHTFGIA